MKLEIFESYTEAVCKKMGVSQDELFSKSKDRYITDARALLFALCDRRGMRKTAIQRLCNMKGANISYTAITNSIRRNGRISDDDDYIRLMERIENNV